MPAFGKNGIVNIKEENNWQLCKPDGTVIKSGLKHELESAKESLSKELGCELIIKSGLKCI